MSYVAGSRRARALRNLLLLLLILSCISKSSATSSTSSSSAAARHATATTTKANNNNNKLDLSYLHRTKPESLAAAIRERLRQQPQTEDTTVDIDLTASLIDKNVQEILETLRPETDAGDVTQSTDDTTAPTTFVRLTARRNQWTSKEATTLLVSLLKEGKDEEKDAAVTTEKDGENDNNDDPAASMSDASDASKPAEDESQDTKKETSTTDSTTSSSIINDDSQDESSSPSISSSSVPRRRPAFVIQSLDLGWNNLGSNSNNNSNKINNNNNKSLKALHKAWQELIAKTDCPTTLRFDVCGLGPPACRAIAKGILARYDDDTTNNDERDDSTTSKQQQQPPLSLHLTCNGGLGDGGVAALAAAIRTVASQQSKRQLDQTKESAGNKDDDVKTTADTSDSASTTTKEQELTILETLDLSGCSITDVGAEALAIALERNPLCVKHLDLSNNQITDEGATSLARALLVRTKNGDRCGMVETLDLSHNKELGDRGAAELAAALQEGCIQNLSLRSCHLHADGAACFGSALKALAKKRAAGEDVSAQQLVIDLSGNPLGFLRKKPKSSSKYSASALKSKATETTAAYIGFLGKTVQKGLKDLGLAEGADDFDTLESDDEEESRMGEAGEEDDESKNKCGAISLAEAFVDDDEEEEDSSSDNKGETPSPLRVKLGLRHCSFDTRAADALAAVLQESRKKQLSMNLTFDMTMNYVLEDETIAALHGDAEYEDQISDMSDNYLEAVAVIREAQERALEAARIARARAREEAELDEAWGSPVAMRARTDGWDDDGYDDAEWDSDADYDIPGDDDW